MTNRPATPGSISRVAANDGTREITAFSTPDGRAKLRLGGREFRVDRYTDVHEQGTGLCPVELIGVSLAA